MSMEIIDPNLTNEAPFAKASHETLIQELELALEANDVGRISTIKQEATARDRWDDTDPRWSHLKDDCNQALGFLLDEVRSQDG